MTGTGLRGLRSTLISATGRPLSRAMEGPDAGPGVGAIGDHGARRHLSVAREGAERQIGRGMNGRFRVPGAECRRSRRSPNLLPIPDSMLHDVLFWLAAATAAGFVATFARLLLAAGQMRRLGDVPPLSIVVAARNEARGIEQAMRSLLSQDAPRLEVVAVDDRSDDATGAILDRFAEGEPRLRVVHVADLPPGWLGKNHALWLGAERAGGELLLFTDADVVMAPDTLRRAAAMMAAGGIDHLPAGMHVDMPGWLLKTFGVFFGLMFTVFSRPWKARDPRSRSHVG